MFDDHEDPLERVITWVRQPMRIDPALDRRVMEAIAQREPSGLTAVWRWLVRPRRVAVSPLGALAAAAVALAVVVALPRGGPRAAPEVATPEFQFVLIAPRAAKVALVGDFNDWDPARTPMHATSRGMWTVVVPLAPGRHRYAFLVDGARWQADPSAPIAADEEFGAPSSVVTVIGS